MALTILLQPVVGVVYNLVLDQMFAAKKNGGATLNGTSISVSQCKGVCGC